MWQRLIILLSIALVVEIIVFLGLKKHLKKYPKSYFTDIVKIIHFIIPIGLAVYFIIHLLSVGYPGLDYKKYRSYFILFGIFTLFFIPRFIFMISVILQGIFDLFKKRSNSSKSYSVRRKKHNSLIIQKIGFFLGIFAFTGIIYGLIWGKKDYYINNITIECKNLPESYDSLKILHFSDAHLGSFINEENGIKGIEMIAEQEVDFVFFTGDMINNLADEMYPYINHFNKINPKYGKYAILGNHDMGDYVQWTENETKEKHIRLLKNNLRLSGFDVLLNSNVEYNKGGKSISIIGVENWGLPPFKQYGDLELAMDGVDNDDFKILLSHDPSHWKAEVIPNTNIDLTLSGHTHGFQFGIDCCGIKFSPSQWIYPQWKGLYNENSQKLFVNSGFGFIGFPGRVGIRPEITIITLTKSNDQ